MNNLLKNLNPEQKEAVTHIEGPLLIVAGAGTGKTTVIARRIAYLIENRLAKSDEILALTFTEKAAGEMEERVEQLLPIGYFDLWISTFHSFAERILRDYCMDIGLPGNFKLLNEYEQWVLIRKNLDRFDLDYYRPLGNPAKFIHALVKHFSRAKDEDVSPREYLEYAEGLRENLDGMMNGGGNKRNKIQDTITKPARLDFAVKNLNLLDDNGLINSSTEDQSSRRSRARQIQNSKLQINSNPEASGQIPKSKNDGGEINREIAEQEILRINEVANAYHIYQQLLLDNGALDFGDLINYCLKLFRERPAILEKYRLQFKYILLDEFQDTNWTQYELVKILAAPLNNLAVIGDDDQSVYAFRGASMSNILHFKQDYPASREIVLKNNYRSRQNILDLAYNFIQQNNPNRLERRLQLDILPSFSPGYKDSALNNRAPKAVESDLKAGRTSALSKKLAAQTKGEGEIAVIEGADLQDEVESVINKIIGLKNNDAEATWNDFAILTRANDSAKDFCAGLGQAGLPYIFYSSRGLYAKPIIMDAISYLKLLDNYHESPALFRVLNMPIFSFTHHELVNFNYWARRKSWSLYETLRNAAVFNAASEILKKVEKILSLIERHTALTKKKNASEILAAFFHDSGYLAHLANQDEQISKSAIDYLNQFLRRIKIFESANNDKTVKAFLNELELEMEAGEQGSLATDPDAGPEAIKVMTIHAAKGLEFKYVFIANMVDKRFPTIERKEQIALPDALVKEILPEGDSHLEEERRLFYVAVTRAKQGLYFSWAEDCGGARKKKPSRFLKEISLIKEEKTIGKELNAIPDGLISNFQFPISKQNPKPKTQNSKINNKEEKTEIAVPSHFSYTQLAAFSNCPYQYRFAHILKVPIKCKASFSFGKTMHLVLQKLFFLINERHRLGQASLFGATNNKTDMTNIVNLEEIMRIYEQSWIDDWYESKNEKEKYRAKGKEILKGFYEKHNNNWPKTVFVEKTFNYKIFDGKDGYTIRGAIDRIDDEEGKLKIIDYKTGRPKDELTFQDKEQLFIYQLAARDLFNKEICALAFYYFENNSAIEFLGSANELEKTRIKILEIIKEIKKGEYPTKPNLLCAYCDFKGICEFKKT